MIVAVYCALFIRATAASAADIPPAYELSEIVPFPPGYITAPSASAYSYLNYVEANGEGYVLYTYAPNALTATHGYLPLVYKGNGQFVQCTLDGLSFNGVAIAGTGTLRSNPVISDVASDGSFRVTAQFHDTINGKLRPIIWTIAGNGSVTVQALENLILPPESTSPGEQGRGMPSSVNSGGLIVGSGNSYLAGVGLKWVTPSPKAQYIAAGTSCFIGYAVDEAGNIVQGSGNDLFYNNTRIPLVTSYRGVASETRNGRVVGTDGGANRPFLFSAGDGTVTQLQSYVDPNDPLSLSSGAAHVNNAGDISGFSGRNQALWQRQSDSSYKVFALKHLVAPSSTPSIDPGTPGTNNRDLDITNDGRLIVAVRLYGASPERTVILRPVGSTGPVAPPHGGLSATVFTVNGSSSPTAGVADTVLRFAAQQTGTPAGLIVRVQYSIAGGTWTDLPEGGHGHMTFDKSGNQFVLNTTSYPLQNNVSFRAIASAAGYPDSISNMIGPFTLASGLQHLGATSLLINANGTIADLFFRAYVPAASPGGIAVRIQSTATPGEEGSWTDLNNGNAGHMAARSVANQFYLLLNSYPAASNLYFRAVTGASGFVDNLSPARGPFTLIADNPPVVTMIPPAGLAGSGDGHDLANPIRVSAGTFDFGATAASQRQIKSLVLQFDGSTIERAAAGVASVRTHYSTSVIGDHVIEAIAIDDLGGRARAGTGPLYVRVVPSTAVSKAISSEGSTTTTAASLIGKVFTVAHSGGIWDDASTWVDGNGNQGVPGISDFAVIGSSSVQFNKEVSVNSLSIDGGRLIGPGYINVYGIMTLARGSVEQYMFIYIQGSAKFLLTNSDDVRFDGVLYNYGLLEVTGSGGVLGMAKLFNHGVLKWLTPQGIHPRAGTDPAADHRVVQANQFSNAGGLIQGVTSLIGQDGTSLVSEKGTGFVKNDGGSLVHPGGGSIVGQDGTSLIGQDGTSLLSEAGSGLISEGGSGIVATDGATVVAGGAGNLISARGVTAAATAGNVHAALEPTGFYQSGGETDLSSVSIAGTVTLDGGILSGTGVIHGDLINNSGYILPGHSAGLIAVLGGFSQGASGTLVIENGGANPILFDRLSVAATANVGGKLDVKLINGYTPDLADTFNPLVAKPVNGGFSVSPNAQVSANSNGLLVSVNPGAPNPKAGQPSNISTRLSVQTGDNVMIAGFIVNGASGTSKQVLIRGLGPTLSQFGVPTVLADPLLELHKPDNSIVTNDNYKSGDTNQIPNGYAPSSDLEPVIVATLSPGNYTAILRGAHGETGNALVEVYDLETSAPTRLGNISTRGLVGTGDNVMIGGVIVQGTEPAKILVRALGPTLTQFGVAGALSDPVLELHDANGNVFSNDDWRNTQEAEISASGKAPPDNREASILVTLAPGNYTAIVRGKDGTTGVALVEGYDVGN